MSNYDDDARATRKKLNSLSPSMCMAKWLQVSLHLPQGRTHSCYHPPTHPIPLSELKANPNALHNTQFKLEERKQMKNGERPSGCDYCWNVEDAPTAPKEGALSDRHYRSSEWWVKDAWEEVVTQPWDHDIKPRYVEVNFNQACNLKCSYCSPHLSTAWEDDIKEHGDFKFSNGTGHNNIDYLRKTGMMPLEVARKDNPYVEAFWKWFPDTYKDLKVFRMTGGEPLMDKNTFKVLDYVNENPNPSLDLSITSNMAPPTPQLMDRFIAKIQKLEEVRVWEDKTKFNPDSGNYWYVAPACKHFSLYVSVDSVGKQAEYIRDGLDFDTMYENCRRVLSETDGTEISFINTFSLLSIPSLRGFLDMVLKLREEFGYENQEDKVIQPPDHNGFKHPEFVRKKRQRVWFDIPYLRYPDWMTIQLADPIMLDTIQQNIDYMKANVLEDDLYGRKYTGFKNYEVLKLERDLAWAKEGLNMSDKELSTNLIRFYDYFTEYDRRRGLNFLEAFPEMTDFWNEAKEEKEAKYGA
ncbi:twitch domain-containing radical SAM protein [bacterium]|nr:twitch domain-containing radical SAM protein [bacterium]